MASFEPLAAAGLTEADIRLLYPIPQREIDVAPGEMVTIDKSGLHSERFIASEPTRGGACVFEHVYFADPSSNIFGENVHTGRKAMGMALAQEAPADADLVVPVPNCARCAAMPA